jgi:hypothetical protein
VRTVNVNGRETLPICIGHDENPKRLALKGTGSIDIVEMRAAVDEFRAGERRAMPILLDLSEATLKFSSADVATLAEDRATENRRSPLGPLALVATADEPFGISRMFKAYSDVNGRAHVGVFRDALTAERWLQSLE